MHAKDAGLLRTPFHQLHVDHGARFVSFAGWEMPILYRSIHEEHRQVRQVGGLFDVSHMGRLKVTGRHARRLLERALTRRVSDMAEKTCRYSLVCNEHGGTLDDVIVYRFGDHWLVVVNSSNREKMVAHLRALAQAGGLVATVEDQTRDTGMVALQGPRVMEHIGRFSSEVPTLRRFAFCVKNVLILKMVISRTGYTGEDGVEVILPAKMAPMAVKLLVKDKGGDGDAAVLRPAGLGARDTLRIEAALPLYGHELDETIDPFSAGLGFAVSLDKHAHENGERFHGQDALEKIAAEGPRRRRVGMRLDGQRTARQGMPVLVRDRQVGSVTSGCVSPTLGYPIAMAMADAQSCGIGDAVEVDVGGTRVAGQVVPLPFYKRV